MRGTHVKHLLIGLMAVMAISGEVDSMIIQIGSGGAALVPAGATWRFFRGKGPASTPVRSSILMFDRGKAMSVPPSRHYTIGFDFTLYAVVPASFTRLLTTR
jgi:hypothetical protein